MKEEEVQRCVFHLEDEEEKLVVHGEISGESDVDYHDDLKLKAVIALLNSVDQVNFTKAEKGAQFNEFMEEIQDVLSEMKSNEHFQGKMNE
ncbi:hypothetical protein MM300_22525 [Evansella sp. LMS18]|uniref:hypothetical protein n=1 Tax=Evansella sp. LMS18 TaxID=2924033 RepID=UPI0020D031A1|nr:hypothetical protein [Evansella sp. LMS18]UTR10604.1 hypothetical protein MM300_22525 [Evansella sp. LMS18]